MADEHDPLADQLIRNEKHVHDVVLRERTADHKSLRAARKTLRDINRLETMAVQVYRAQWTREPTELNRQLIGAMENELMHQNDSLGRLMEFGGRPTILRLPFYIVGWVMGRVSRLLGLRAMMNLGAWVEGKAIEHYQHLSDACRWHPQTYEMLLKMWDDERVHRRRWLHLRDHPEVALGPPLQGEGDGPPGDSDS
jgi:demethoxyubiquinone hydroxylase (CLK1/Coq7/Cat5 family)